jgi:hypothetical protein
MNIYLNYPERVRLTLAGHSGGDYGRGAGPGGHRPGATGSATGEE